ncbi:hypothetical protein BBR01nite_08540 [Brevibacillus brevis]|nr:hypothetical protein BBR01nite_08540 [Brevibacillus brevis]
MKAMIRLNVRPPHAKYRLTISRLCMSRCGMWQIESIRHWYTPLEVWFSLPIYEGTICNYIRK